MLLWHCAEGWKIEPFGASPLAHAQSTVNTLLDFFVLVLSKFLQTASLAAKGPVFLQSLMGLQHTFSAILREEAWPSGPVSFSEKLKEPHSPFRLKILWLQRETLNDW